MARLCPLFSGSSGNSYYIGSTSSGVLIDTGRSAKQMVNMIETCGLDMRAVKAIFVTHEHSDHVQGLRVLASKYHIDVFSSLGTLNALQDAGSLAGDFRTEIIPDMGVACCDMLIQPFRTSHDSAESVGYRVETSDGRVAAIATDLGFMSDGVREAISGADLLVLESNHDVGMLQNGPYPYPLKKRILSDMGHLSNVSCADELFRFAKGGTTRFILGHLSKENNTPELAYETAKCALTMEGLQQDLDYVLEVAPRENQQGRCIFF